MSFLSRWVDERFFRHRQRSTSIAGVSGGVLTLVLFYYRYYFDHVWSWDLFAVGLTFVTVKLTLMAWYFLTD